VLLELPIASAFAFLAEAGPRAGEAGSRETVVNAESLYRQHRERVYHLCLRLGGGRVAWAEDATQDVFVKLLANLDALAEQEDLGGWIYRVTMNTCLSRLKRDGSVWRKVARALGARPEAAPETPERQLQLREELRRVADAVHGLPAKERVVFCMKHLDELEQREIAATLSMSEGYVSKLLHRAQDHLERRGWEVPRA
jgi:RNA polymerase sigma-70 factor (ECF subfamily)